MSHSTFVTIATQQGWTQSTQITVLLDFIESGPTAGKFSDYLARRASEENDRSDDCGVTKPIIAGEVHADDHIYTAEFDAVAWFQQASDEAIIEVANAQFSASESTDQIALFFENNAKYKDVAKLFEYLSHHPKLRGRDPVGYSCNIDPNDALVWVAKTRPHLLEEAAELSGQDIGSYKQIG